jgi:hypothetical protein
MVKNSTEVSLFLDSMFLYMRIQADTYAELVTFNFRSEGRRCRAQRAFYIHCDTTLVGRAPRDVLGSTDGQASIQAAGMFQEKHLRGPENFVRAGAECPAPVDLSSGNFDL